jgi:hypothetical protein
MSTPRHRSYRRRTLNRLVTDAPHAHPHVRLVFSLMRQQRVTLQEMEDASGVKRPTIKAWRRKNLPGLASLTAVLNTLGWDYVPVPHTAKLPTELAAEIAKLAERFKIELPEVFAMLLEVGADQRELAEHGMKGAWQSGSGLIGTQPNAD